MQILYNDRYRLKCRCLACGKVFYSPSVSGKLLIDAFNSSGIIASISHGELDCPESAEDNYKPLSQIISIKLLSKREK